MLHPLGDVSLAHRQVGVTGRRRVTGEPLDGAITPCHRHGASAWPVQVGDDLGQRDGDPHHPANDEQQPGTGERGGEGDNEQVHRCTTSWRSSSMPASSRGVAAGRPSRTRLHKAPANRAPMATSTT